MPWIQSMLTNSSRWTTMVMIYSVLCFFWARTRFFLVLFVLFFLCGPWSRSELQFGTSPWVLNGVKFNAGISAQRIMITRARYHINISTKRAILKNNKSNFNSLIFFFILFSYNEGKWETLDKKHTFFKSKHGPTKQKIPFFYIHIFYWPKHKFCFQILRSHFGHCIMNISWWWWWWRWRGVVFFSITITLENITLFWGEPKGTKHLRPTIMTHHPYGMAAARAQVRLTI